MNDVLMSSCTKRSQYFFFNSFSEATVVLRLEVRISEFLITAHYVLRKALQLHEEKWV